MVYFQEADSVTEHVALLYKCRNKSNFFAVKFKTWYDIQQFLALFFTLFLICIIIILVLEW